MVGIIYPVIWIAYGRWAVGVFHYTLCAAIKVHDFTADKLRLWNNAAMRKAVGEILMDNLSIRLCFSKSYVDGLNQKQNVKTSATGNMTTRITRRFYFVFERIIFMEINVKRILILIVLFILNDNILELRSLMSSLQFEGGIDGDK